MYVWLALLCVATGLVVALALQSRALRSELAQVRRDAALPPVGLRVPPVTAVTLTGDTVVLGRTSQVLLFFTTTCPSCRQAVPLWNQLVRRQPGSPVAFEVWALSAESFAATAAFVDSMGFEPQVAIVDTADFFAYRVGAVPLVVVVSPDGRVLFRRPGVPSLEALDSIVAAPSRTADDSLAGVVSPVSGGRP
ncbi:MAG: hypothetical protein WEC54_00720 [Gemmatimonadales bacterium]